MGIGGILRGLTTAAGGAEQGIANRQELERQARLQLLADRLQQAQLQNYASEGKRREDQTRLEQEKLEILKKKPTPGQLGKYKAIPNPTTGEVDYVWEPAPGQLPTSAPPGSPAVIPNLGRVSPRIAPTERKAAGEAEAAESANRELTQLENANPKVLAEVAKFMAAPAVAKVLPWVGNGFADVIRQARTAGLSDGAQTYIKRLYDFASLAGPARYGRNFRNEVLLQQVWSDFGAGQLGVSAGGISATQRNRANATRAMRTTAGPAMTGHEDRPSPGNRKSYRPDNPFVTPP